MQRFSVALIVNLCWLAAAVVAAGALALFGLSPVAFGLAGLAALGAVTASLIVARRADRQFADRLTAIGQAVLAREFEHGGRSLLCFEARRPP